MTETDATRRPLSMPENFIPYLQKYRIYKIFKDMTKDLIVNLPKDHLKHIKIFLNKYLPTAQNAHRVVLLASPELTFIDIEAIVMAMKKEFGFSVITRRYVMDSYEKHDDYEPGCISPTMMASVTKLLTFKEPVPQIGWIMFDHPCTLHEARCLQQEGILPTVTLVLRPPPSLAPRTVDPRTPARGFYQQDFEGLTLAYKNTSKEIHIEPHETTEGIVSRCLNAIQACMAGASAEGHSHQALGAPGVYRVLLLGPRGSGRRTHAAALAQHFNLVCLNYEDIYKEALERKDEVGEKLCNYGPSVRLRADIIRRRLMRKDCIDQGWVLIGYPTCGIDFENLDTMKTPPNRIIFLSVDWETCKERLAMRGVDWCTGKPAAVGSGPRVQVHPRDQQPVVDRDLEYYFSEALGEMRAAAGLTAVEIDARGSVDKVQVNIQAAVMAAPSFDIECSARVRVQCSKME